MDSLKLSHSTFLSLNVRLRELFTSKFTDCIHITALPPVTPPPPPGREVVYCEFCVRPLDLGLVYECQISAVPGRQTFECTFSNPLASVTCSFDGGPGETCSFPLEVGIGRFGTDRHTVDVTVVDVFGQSEVVSFNFSLIERKTT